MSCTECEELKKEISRLNEKINYQNLILKRVAICKYFGCNEIICFKTNYYDESTNYCSKHTCCNRDCLESKYSDDTYCDICQDIYCSNNE